MGPRVVDDEEVADLHLGELAVAGKLVVVLAEVARDVVDVGGGQLGLVRASRLAHHGDVVVGAVHRRADEVARSGVDADVVLIDMLLVNDAGHEAPVWSGHEASHLGAHGDIAHAGGHEHLLVRLAHALADGAYIVGTLVGPIGNAHPAREVHEGDVRAGLAPESHR